MTHQASSITRLSSNQTICMICKCSALFQNLLLFKIKPVLEMSQHVTKKCKQIPAPFHCSYTHYILSETAFIKNSPYTSETPSLPSPLLTKFGRRSPPVLRIRILDPHWKKWIRIGKQAMNISLRFTIFF